MNTTPTLRRRCGAIPRSSRRRPWAHRFTPLAIRPMLAELDLELVSVDVPAAVLAKYRARFPGDPAGLDLSLWDQFEADNPTVFSGMIGMWCRKRPSPVSQRT